MLATGENGSLLRRKLGTFGIRSGLLTAGPPTTDSRFGALDVTAIRWSELPSKNVRPWMVNSPIGIRLSPSSSRQPSDLVKTQAIAADALKIEHYINSRMNKEYIREFDFSVLAMELSIDRDRVCALLSKLAGNENAIAICNPQKRPKTPAAGPAKIAGSECNQSDAAAPVWIESHSIASEVSM